MRLYCSLFPLLCSSAEIATKRDEIRAVNADAMAAFENDMNTRIDDLKQARDAHMGDLKGDHFQRVQEWLDREDAIGTAVGEPEAMPNPPPETPPPGGK